MKYYFLNIILGLTLSSHAQWNHILHSGNNSYDIRCIDCIDDTTCVAGAAIGSDGFILRTTDGGITWNTTLSITGNLMLGCTYASEDTVFATGGFNSVYRSTDGGLNWTLLNLNLQFTHHFKEIFFTDSHTGCVSYSDGGAETVCTQDGGLTWVNYDTIGGRDFAWYNSTGYSIGGVAGQSFNIADSIEWGAWYNTNTGNRSYFAIEVFNDSTILVAGNYNGPNFGTLALTQDSMQTWVTADFNVFKFRDIEKLTDSSCVMSSIPGPYIYYSPDNGKSWFTQNIVYVADTGIGIDGITCPSDSVCYGFAGRNIWKTTNAGGPLTPVSSGAIDVRPIITAYPNPTSGIVRLEGLPQNIASRNIQVTNTLGQQVPVVLRENSIDLSGQPPGLYLVTVNFGAFHGFTKVLKR